MKISVYITSYNQKHYLKEAIDSVLNQSKMPFEVLIIDDASTDGSIEIIKEYQQQFPELIRTHINKSNMGISRTRNIALKQLRGDYVTFVDGDDLFHHDKLFYESEALSKNPQASIAFSNFDVINDTGQELYKWILDDFEDDLFERLWMFQWPKGGPFRSPLINLKQWKEIGFYDESLEIFEDFDMMLRLSHELKSVHIGRSLSKYRKHIAGISNKKLNITIKLLNYIYKKNAFLLAAFNNRKRKMLEKNREAFMIHFQLKKVNAERKDMPYFNSVFKLLLIITKKPKLLFTKAAVRILVPNFH